MKIITLLFFVIFISVYCISPDFVVVMQNKLDTLYMVSTIFFSAAIGMVISNNIHLNNQKFKEEVRKMNSHMTLLFTICFLLETVVYFVYNDSMSHYKGLHLHLIVLGLITFTTIVYTLAIPIVLNRIAKIENSDYDELKISERNNTIKLQQQRILEHCINSPQSKNSIRQLLLLNSNQDIFKLVNPLIDEGYLVEVDKGYCSVEYAKKIYILVVRMTT